MDGELGSSFVRFISLFTGCPNLPDGVKNDMGMYPYLLQLWKELRFSVDSVEKSSAFLQGFREAEQPSRDTPDLST